MDRQADRQMGLTHSLLRTGGVLPGPPTTHTPNGMGSERLWAAGSEKQISRALVPAVTQVFQAECGVGGRDVLKEAWPDAGSRPEAGGPVPAPAPARAPPHPRPQFPRFSRRQGSLLSSLWL